MSAVDPRLGVLAALLAQGRAVHLTTAVVTLGAWGLSGGALWLSLAVALVWAIESWFAARVGLDSALFTELAAGRSLAELDRGLVELGLIRERASRSVSDRIAGAVRLWRWQLGAAGVQGALLLWALFGWRIG